MDGIEKCWQSIQLILAAQTRKEKGNFLPLLFLDVSVSLCVLGTEPKTMCFCFFNCVLSSRCFASSPSNIIFKTHAQFAVSLKSTRSIGFKTKSNILGTALNSKQFVFFAMLRSLFALFHFLAFFFSRQSKNPLKQFI